MDLTTSYLGLSLGHPFVVGASPLGDDLDSIRVLEDSGAAAIVLRSLFEEQITLESSGLIRQMDPSAEPFRDALAGFPAAGEYVLSAGEYLEHVRRVKDTVGIPVIASLNGVTSEAWLETSLKIQQAGADALELNVFDVVSDPAMPGVAVEAQLCDIVVALAKTLAIPVAVKLPPFFTALGNMAAQLDRAGAAGLVLFNRAYEPDIDAQTLSLTRRPSLSSGGELPLRLQWLALLHGRFRGSLAVSGGVADAIDGVKAILAGADAVQLVSSILRRGPRHLTRMREGLVHWMREHEFDSLSRMRGRLSLAATGNPDAFDRRSYIRGLQAWSDSGDQRGAQR